MDTSKPDMTTSIIQPSNTASTILQHLIQENLKLGKVHLDKAVS